jgi:hypothetical protein
MSPARRQAYLDAHLGDILGFGGRGDNGPRSCSW